METMVDGSERLTRVLRGDIDPAPYLPVHRDSQMLHDAAAEIERLRAAIASAPCPAPWSSENRCTGHADCVLNHPDCWRATALNTAPQAAAPRIK